jgi:N-acetylmuramoyl-L-alanine amidase
MQENKAILLEKDYQTKYAGFDPTLPESYIIFNNVQNNNLNQSLEMATMVQDQLRAKAQRKDLGVHQGNLVVLWQCAKPSVLIETGFISNPEEEAFLMTENGQDIIASAIYAAFREYKESVDSRIGDISKTTPAVTKTVTEPVREEKRTVDTILKNKESVTTPAAKPPTRDESIKPAEITQKSADSSTVQNKVSQPASSGVEYRVQLLASQKRLPLNSKEFKGTPDIKEFNLDGYYKYMSQPVYTYPEALELRRRLGASFKGAFIVAFKNGERVPVTSTISQQKN